MSYRLTKEYFSPEIELKFGSSPPKYGSRIGYIHLKDVDAYALSKAEGSQKMGTFRALGHGTVDFPAVKAALEEEGFDGVMCVELDNPKICNFHSAQVSRAYLKDVLEL